MLAQFNKSKDFFICISEDNRIKVWDVASNVVRQEYSECDHLKHAYTSMSWVDQSAWKSTKKNKRGISDGLGIVALGTDNGDIAIWDLEKGEVVQRLSKGTTGKGHSTAVNDVKFSKNGKILYSTANEKYILEWDVKTGEILRKFRFSKEGASRLSLSDDNNVLAAASTSIRLFDISSGKKSKQLSSGHSSSVNCLQFSSCNRFLISSSKSGRFVNIFDCESEKDEPLCNLSLDSSPKSVFLQSNSKESAFLLGCVSETGSLFLWNPTLRNIISTKPVTPISKFTSAGSNGSSSDILCGEFVIDSKNRVLVARGSSVKPVFQGVDFVDESGSFLKEIELKNNANSIPNSSTLDSKKSKPEIDNNVHVIAGLDRGLTKVTIPEDKVSVNGLTDEDSDEDEMTLAEKVNALREKIDSNMQDIYATEKQNEVEVVKENKPQSDSLSTVLEQALQSKDNVMLEYCLQVTDKKMIDSTIRRLPSTKVISFIIRVVDKFEKKPSRGTNLCCWIRSILMHHTSYLMTVPDLVQSLSSLYQALEMRLKSFQQLYKLSGRLSLALGQISQRSQIEKSSTMQPKVVYNEGEDDEEDEDDEEEENNKMDTDSEEDKE